MPSSRGPRSTRARQLEARLADTEARLAEAEETLRAIRHGEVDALVVSGPEGDQIFTLQGAETPYRWLVEEMNEGALLVALEGTILFANARFAALAGRQLHDVIGSQWQQFFVAGQQPGLDALVAAAATKTGVKAECALQTGAGTVQPVEVSVARMQRQGLEGYSVIVTDLRERKLAEEALRASNARLREMVAELEHFSYSISHDMRAPLRAMKSFAALLEEDCAMCDRQESRELLSRISVAASRLDDLIQGSLEYARVVKEDLVLRPVALGNLVHGIPAMYPSLSPARTDLQVEGQLPVVLGNEAALTRAFSNLLVNAAKFVAAGVRPRIRVWAERVSATPDRSASNRQAAFVRIWIEDNGIGIPKAAQGRIFDLFQRATKDYEGTGIGLAVVRKVIERMGGRAGVESREGQGSRFWVELKVADVSSPSA